MKDLDETLWKMVIIVKPGVKCMGLMLRVLLPNSIIRLPTSVN